jgi:hypothetical protein
MTSLHDRPASAARDPLRLPTVVVVIVALILLAWGLEVLFA